MLHRDTKLREIERFRKATIEYGCVPLTSVLVLGARSAYDHS